MLDPSGLVTNWNAGAERITGHAAEDIVGQHFSRLYTKEDRADGAPARALATATRDGKYESEGWRIRKDASRFWGASTINAVRDGSGALFGFAKIIRDITERRSAQEALRESERQFRLMVSGVTDYALFMLDPNGIVSSWNAGAQRIKGYLPDEIIGSHFSRFFTEADRSAGVPAHALFTATKEGRYEAEGWRVRKDGSLFFASAILDAIRDEEGTLIGFAKITRDITERKNAEVALSKAQERIARSQKVEALGQLTGGVAHDFNNLLMIVSGHIHTLKGLVAGDPKGERAAAAIELAAQRGEALTRQLLGFARRQSLNPKAVHLHDSLDRLRDVLASSLGNASLAIDVPPETWPVEVDESELALALVNTALNARDAMPQGGAITIAAQNATLRRGELDQSIEGDFVALTVADRGVGIPADIMPRVFDPFFSTKEFGKGTGLGLSQVHGFAHQSGGTVDIQSEIGRGTRITLYLPKAGREPDLSRKSDSSGSEHGRGTILLVEDNPEVAAVSFELLQQLGYAVRSASNAEDALRTIKADPGIDLVFSDIVMAGSMDGLALARAIKQIRPQVPVLLATGYSKAAEDAKAAFPILHKPYQIQELGRAVAKLMAEARGEIEASNLVHLEDAKRSRTGKRERP